MNADYSKNRAIYSENGIYRSYYESGAKTARGTDSFLRYLLAALSALLGVRVGERARRIIRVSAVLVSLIGLLCVAAAIEAGSLGLGTGLLLGGLCILPELLCLARH